MNCHFQVKLENDLAKLIAKREKLLAMKRPSETRNRHADDDWGVDLSYAVKEQEQRDRKCSELQS